LADGNPLRVAVVGAGAIAGSHRTAYRAHHDDVDLVAVADVDQARALAFCATTDHARPYHDLDSLLAEQKPDFVSICTPPGLV
jgi:predicted dehydrogenase